MLIFLNVNIKEKPRHKSTSPGKTSVLKLVASPTYLQYGHYKTQQFKDLEEKGDFVATVDANNIPIYMPMCSLILVPLFALCLPNCMNPTVLYMYRSHRILKCIFPELELLYSALEN